MGIAALTLIQAVQTALLGAFLTMLPRFGRRGLLFGVYVGEESSASEDARRIVLVWYQRMALWVGLSVASAAVVSELARSPLALAASDILLVAGFYILYVSAHRAARHLAHAREPIPAAAPLAQEETADLAFPLATLAFGIACGLFAVAYALSECPSLPDRIPIHFDVWGKPDAWTDKSLRAVMLLPVLCLYLGATLGSAGLLTIRAKRAIRREGSGVSFVAQQRFQSGLTRFLCGAALLASSITAAVSAFQLRAAQGRASGLPLAVILLGLCVGPYVLFGTFYLAFRYGQGGARLEHAAAGAALTDGLADNSKWALGLFYVNWDDPSFLVEQRFGLGYTFNFGNWKAVVFFGSIIVSSLGFVLLALTGW